MSELPLISVYIPTHNRKEKLHRAIKSVLNQTYENFEVIVCDDGSTDSTMEFITDIQRKNPKIHYVRNEKPLGACSARNLGIFSARGEFITGLDDDDEFAPDRLAKLLNTWNDKYSFICSNFSNSYEGGTKTEYYRAKKTEFTFRDLLIHNEASNQVFTKTKHLQSIGGFKVGVRRLQDWDTWIRLSYKHGNFFRIKEPLYVMHHDHRINETRVSQSCGLDSALEALMEGNKDIYEEWANEILRREIRSIRQEYTQNDMLHDLVYKKSLKPLLKYIRQLIFQRNKIHL